jgi:hypothetical protein
MRMTVVALALVVGGCGGGDDPEADPAAEFRADAMVWAETLCETNGGLRRVLDESYSYSRNGTLLDVGLRCRCRNGTIVNTPMRRE